MTRAVGHVRHEGRECKAIDCRFLMHGFAGRLTPEARSRLLVLGSVCRFEPGEFLLRDAEIRRLAAQADHVLKQELLNYLEMMRDRCLEFVRQIDTDPLGSIAAQLADKPERLADLIEKRESDRERVTGDLQELCNTASDAYREMGVFEFVSSTDTAFSRLLRHIGVDGTPMPSAGLANGSAEASNGSHPSPEQG